MLKTDAVVDHLPASSYAKFVGSHEHPKGVIVLYGLANSFYKKQAFTTRGLDSSNDPYKLKFNAKIRRYPAMPFMVMCFKERNLQRTIWNCLKPYDGSFSKIGEIEIWRISDSKGVSVFPKIPFKDVRILRWNEGREQSGAVAFI